MEILLEILEIISSVLRLVDFILRREKKVRWVRSWRSILKDIDKLHDHLVEKHVKVDCIIGFSDGGLIVADLLFLRHYYPDIPVISIPLEIEWRPNDLRTVKVKPNCLNGNFFAEKSILVIDDVIQTGLSMGAVVTFLRRSQPDRIYTMVLGKPRDIEVGFITDYRIFEYTGKIKLPWGKVPRH